MDNEAVIALVRNFVTDILSADPAYFLVEARIKPVNNLKVFIDGDQGVTIEKCVQVNRALYKKIEEAGLFPAGDFSLEVSSAGLDEPLKSLRQYRKNIGRTVELTLTDSTRKTGRLVEVAEDGIVLEEKTGRQAHSKAPAGKLHETYHSYLFNNIKTTKVQVVF
jgi:ribosome maturation factor RimP